MNRSRVALAAAVVAVAALAGCSGGDASQSDVQDDVAEILTEDGYGEHTDLSATQVGAASACVAQSLFDPDQFTKDERNEVASSVDSELPPPELVTTFVRVIDLCVEEAVTDAEDDEGSGDEEQTSDADDESTTTTGDDESTTTTD